MAKEKQKYEIEKVTYVRKPTGEVYPNDANPSYLKGKRKYGKSELKDKKTTKSTWSDLKQKAFEASRKDKKVSVRWSKPQTRLVSITKELSDGTKETTYFNPKRK